MGKTGTRTKMSPLDLNALEQSRTALELRRQGLTYDAIADQMGTGGSGTAWKQVNRALDAARAERLKSADKLLDLELERLDYYLRSLDPKVQNGEVGAITTAVKICERRSKMLGLEKLLLDVTVTPEDAAEQIRAVLAESLPEDEAERVAAALVGGE